MYAAQPGTKAWEHRKKLLSLAESGDAVFPLSFFQFFEFLQASDSNYLSDRISRVEFMQAITRDWSFPYYEDLTDTAQVLVGPYWMPQDALDTFDVASLVSELKNRIARESKVYPQLFPNRASRRRIVNDDVFRRWIEAHPQALADSAGFEGGWFRLAFDQGIIRKYVLRQISRSEANQIIRARALSIAVVYHYYFESNSKNPITDGLRPIKENWERQLTRLEAALSAVYEQIKQIDGNQAGLDSLLQSEFPAIRQRAYSILRERKRLRAELRHALKNPVDTSRVSLFGKSEKFEAQFRACMSATINGVAAGSVPFAQSLIADMMHSSYLPYCDLWRGDRSFSHLLRSAGVPNSNKIVSRLGDLPGKIAALTDRKP